MPKEENTQVRCSGCGAFNPSSYRFCKMCGATLRRREFYTCPTCHGTGTIMCPRCSGTGTVGDYSCSECGGSGTVVCHTCSGRARVGEFEIEVHGTDAEDVERVTKTLLEKGLQKMASNKVEVHLHNSTLGILNTGEIENMHSISLNVSTLSYSGFREVANALKKLTEAIATSQEISSAQRAELLEQVDELSAQASLPAEKRSKPGVIKAILTSVATVLSAAGGLAEVWSTWGAVISKFLGF